MKKVCENQDCGKVFETYRATRLYCCRQCDFDHKKYKTLQKWLVDGGKPHITTIKAYIKSLHGDKCSNCKIEDWQGIPIVFELEHKDGNSENNELENLCLLCPNCHSQTPTYKNRNMGNGRHSRRERYAQGKSY